MIHIYVYIYDNIYDTHLFGALRGTACLTSRKTSGPPSCRSAVGQHNKNNDGNKQAGGACCAFHHRGFPSFGPNARGSYGITRKSARRFYLWEYQLRPVKHCLVAGRWGLDVRQPIFLEQGAPSQSYFSPLWTITAFPQSAVLPFFSSSPKIREGTPRQPKHDTARAAR